MLSNCISIGTSRVLVLVLVSAHARRKQGRFERRGHLPVDHDGMDQKQRRPAKQIPPYGAEGYILVSTNWLLWLTFRRTNMDPYRSVSNGRSTSKTLSLCVQQQSGCLNATLEPLPTVEKRATGNICEIVTTRPRPDCVNHNSWALIHAADTSLVCCHPRFVHFVR